MHTTPTLLPIDEQATIWSVPEAERLEALTDRPLLLMLHGFGSSGSDMIALAPAWQEALPDTLFLAPHAPQRCGMMGAGYQWWGLSGFAPSALAAGAASAAPAVDAFIDRKLDQYGLTEADLALVGFSQGTMMALQIGLRRPRAVAAVVGYSGMLAGSAGRQRQDSRDRVTRAGRRRSQRRRACAPMPS